MCSISLKRQQRHCSTRYIVDPSKKTPVTIQPPFLQPDLSDRQVTIKISDNGIHGNILRSKSKGSLDVLNDKQPDTQPPLPPKADKYKELKSQLTSSEESSLSSKPLHPSTPAMYKYRPSFGTIPKVHYHTGGEKITMQDDRNPGAILEEGSRAHDYRSEPNLDLPDYRNPPLHRSFQSSPLQLDSSDMSSHSLSLKQAHRHGDQAPAQALLSEGAAHAPHRSVFPPSMLSNRNGSLSYDSLLSPSVAVSAGECLSHPGAPVGGLHSPYLPVRASHTRASELQRQPPPTYSPVLGGEAGHAGRRSPHPRDPSPVRYDNLSKTIMASIQERKEMEEREKLLHMHGRQQGTYDSASTPNLPPATCYPEGRGSRGPTPPAYGSRDNLVGGGTLRGLTSSSSLSRAPRTSSTSLHAEASGGATQGRPVDAPYRSPAHQPHRSPSALPRSPSYAHRNPLPFISALERTDSPILGGPRYENEIHGKMTHGKVNGQLKDQLRLDCRLGPSPSGQGVPLSPSRHTNVKKVSGVGGTTYEISV
ncbi:putative palmitoyltransferase ZDHHC8 [Arapaima gigas]